MTLPGLDSLINLLHLATGLGLLLAMIRSMLSQLLGQVGDTVGPIVKGLLADVPSNALLHLAHFFHVLGAAGLLPFFIVIDEQGRRAVLVAVAEAEVVHSVLFTQSADRGTVPHHKLAVELGVASRLVDVHVDAPRHSKFRNFLHAGTRL